MLMTLPWAHCETESWEPFSLSLIILSMTYILREPLCAFFCFLFFVFSSKASPCLQCTRNLTYRQTEKQPTWALAILLDICLSCLLVLCTPARVMVVSSNLQLQVSSLNSCLFHSKKGESDRHFELAFILFSVSTPRYLAGPLFLIQGLAKCRLI